MIEKANDDALVTASGILKRIAEEENIPTAEVKSSIISAIEDMKENGSEELKSFLSAVPRKDTLPTPEEFIAYAVCKIKESQSRI